MTTELHPLGFFLPADRSGKGLVPDTGMRGDRGNRAESDGYSPLRIARHGGAESGLLVGIFLYGKDDEAVPYAFIL